MTQFMSPNNAPLPHPHTCISWQAPVQQECLRCDGLIIKYKRWIPLKNSQLCENIVSCVHSQLQHKRAYSTCDMQITSIYTQCSRAKCAQHEICKIWFYAQSDYPPPKHPIATLYIPRIHTHTHTYVCIFQITYRVCEYVEVYMLLWLHFVIRTHHSTRFIMRICARALRGWTHIAAINLSSTSPAGEEEEMVGGRSGVGWGGKSGTAKCRAAFRNLCCERLLRDYRDDIIAGVVAISRESRRNNRRVVCILCIFSAYILWVLDQVNTEPHTAWCIYFLIGKFVYIYIYAMGARTHIYWSTRLHEEVKARSKKRTHGMCSRRQHSSL